MKLTKEECLEALENVKYWAMRELGINFIILEQLIDEHFNNSLAGQVDKLKKDLDITCKLHDELLENYNKQKKRMKQLEQENGKLKKQVHSYYMAMVTGKGE